jgi:excisionase family DNA binding protein
MPDALAILDEIDAALIPAAIAKLAARAMTPARDDSADEYLTPDQVAALLKVPKRWAYANARKLGAIKLSRRALRFPAARVRRYLEARK